MDVDTIRSNILAMTIDNLNLGSGGNEDMFGALMFAMNEQVDTYDIYFGTVPAPGAATLAALAGVTTLRRRR